MAAPQTDGPESLRRELEATVPAEQFGAADSAAVGVTGKEAGGDITPERYLLRTDPDRALTTPTVDTSAPDGFDQSSNVPVELLAAGQQVGARFEVAGQVGRGGTATVYAVRDNSLGRTVALKLLRGRAADRPTVKNRFIHEARATAFLEHPNIVPVYDIGVTEQKRVYFLMKNVTGVTVGDAIRAEGEGRPVPEEFRTIQGRLRVFHKVCDALAFAHDKGYVHQDVKPDNIMLGEYGEVLVLDWGCALSTSERQENPGGVSYGTPAYMSPEQARRERADERSDIYCLGATLYHMLTLQHPTWDDDPERFWQMKRDGELSPLAPEAAARVPPALLAIVRRALAPRAEDRFASVKELQNALVEYQEHAESAALADAAEQRLAAAAAARDYRGFGDITAELRQALRMWPENAAAAQALLRAERAHAECALDRGDLELAISIVEGTPELADLCVRIEQELSRREKRGRTLRWVWYAAAALALMVAALFGYYILDFLRYFGKWHEVCSVDFTRPGFDTSAVALSYLRHDVDDRLKPATSRGLSLTPVEMLWVRKGRVAGDVRFEVRARWPSSIDGLELDINARRERDPAAWVTPAGYAGQFGGWSGTVNLIASNRSAGVISGGNAIAAHLKPGRVYRFWFQRSGERLSLHVDGREVYHLRDPVPLVGEGHDWCMVRSWGEAEVLSLAVWRKGAPQKASAVIVGDAFVRRGDLQTGISEYLRIALDQQGTRVAQEALLRAYLTASLIPDADTVRAAIRAEFRERYPRSRLWPRVLESWCLELWRAGKADSALSIAESILDRDPSARIALHLLAAVPVRPAPAQAQRLLRLAARTRNVSRLQLDNLGLTDLSPLRGMRLVSLDCRRNEISDLSPLSGMPLRRLVASINRINSLEPLRGAPLEALELAVNMVTDISALKGMKLKSLNFADNRVTSLEPLRGMALERLQFPSNLVTSLEPLRGSPILWLDATNNPVGTLEPLRDMPLRVLYVNHTGITSLEPLRGMPLVRLLCGENELNNLAPIAGMHLEEFSCSWARIRSLEPLRGMPLRSVEFAGNEIESLEPLRGAPSILLDCSFNRISDISPLAGMPLAQLRMQGNRVTDLSPLAGMPLTTLTAENNLLRSLAPFEGAHPAWFTFDCATLEPGYVQQMTTRWQNEADTANPRYAAALRALRTMDIAAMRRLARPYNGRLYLYVPRFLEHDSAAARAAAAGGHLVTVTSAEEQGWVMSQVVTGQSVWLGLVPGPDGDRWCTDEPWGYEDFVFPDNRMIPMPKFLFASPDVVHTWNMATTARVRSHLMVEWER